jgi:copper chaperone CopZ
MPSGTRLAEPRPTPAVRATVRSHREPLILHAALPGRLRIQLHGWSPDERETVERRLGMIPGVREVTANPETGNVLLLYNPAVTDVERLVQAAGRAMTPERPNPASPKRARPRRPASNSAPTPPAAGPTRSKRLVRTVVLNFSALLSLLISILTCATPFGAARVGLEALQLVIQITFSSV